MDLLMRVTTASYCTLGAASAVDAHLIGMPTCLPFHAAAVLCLGSFFEAENQEYSQELESSLFWTCVACLRFWENVNGSPL